MRTIMLKLSALLLCLMIIATPTAARTTAYHSEVSANPATSVTTTYYTNVRAGAHHRREPRWIPMHAGQPIPVSAVVGGSQHHPSALFYICRANYRGGVHPGKYLSGNCNISWGGSEIIMQHYEILLSDKPLIWIEESDGNIPNHAIAGGSENGNPLFICQADYKNGTHPGKIIGENCNFGWGGHEMMAPYYKVLANH